MNIIAQTLIPVAAWLFLTGLVLWRTGNSAIRSGFRVQGSDRADSALVAFAFCALVVIAILALR